MRHHGCRGRCWSTSRKVLTARRDELRDASDDACGSTAFASHHRGHRVQTLHLTACRQGEPAIQTAEIIRSSDYCGPPVPFSVSLRACDMRLFSLVHWYGLPWSKRRGAGSRRGWLTVVGLAGSAYEWSLLLYVLYRDLIITLVQGN